MIIQTVRHYDFSKVKWDSRSWGNEVFDPAFLFCFRAKPAELSGALVSHASGFALRIADKAHCGEDEKHLNRRVLNYLSCTAPDGSCRVLEADLRMENDAPGERYRIGFPISLAGDPETEHEFAVLYDGVCFQILCDGIVMDRDFPFGRSFHCYEGRHVCFGISSPALANYRMTNDLSGVSFSEKEVRRDASIQFYTPFGFNTWVGDVVVAQFRGRFHIFYLMDRRHHGSRVRRGAHEFWHLSSENLRDWIDHGPVVEIDSQWQTVGTGNAFVFDGKLHLSFGWHTDRQVPYPQTVKHLFFRNLADTGRTGEFRYGEIGTLLPSGASYTASEDGVHFTRADRLIHYLENPSIFVQPDGRLHLIQDGVWESDHPGDWTLVQRGFPPHDMESFARNCLDCPTRFELDGWEYFAVGFSAFFGRRKGDAEWIDFVKEGRDPYDGSSVPMYSAWRDGRMIEGGWMNGIGWGSCLMLREMVPLGNGNVGKRWVAESLPEFGAAENFSEKTPVAAAGDTLLEFRINPAKGAFAIRFTGEGEGCEFRIDPAKARAQWSSAGCPPEVPTFREQMTPEISNYSSLPYTAYCGRDYAKENLFGIDAPFVLRVLIHADPKLNAALIDVEIAGCHTMATLRGDFAVRSAEASGAGTKRFATIK